MPRNLTAEKAEGLLRRALADGAAQFREGQWEAIDAVVNRRRKLLVVQRTGWGKSAVYFIATRALRDAGAGATLIVSPLLALMRNQIEAARRLGIQAETINSTNQDEWEQVQRRILSGEADAVLVAPERLANEGFVEQVLLPLGDRIGLLVVDEAHCISDWGHDFRPDYRRIVNVLRQMPPQHAGARHHRDRERPGGEGCTGATLGYRRPALALSPTLPLGKHRKWGPGRGIPRVQ